MTVALVTNKAMPISSALSFAFGADNMGKLDNYGRLGVWSPQSLFSSGEQGAWFYPSDLSTMFQDSVGTTPVTADGQPVGLALDKSKGLALGPELVTNGDFSSGGTGWIPTGANWSFSGGAAISDGTTAGGIFQSGIVVYGKTYQVEFDVSGTGVGGIRLGSASVTQLSWNNSPGHKTAKITADNGTFVFIQSEIGTGFSVDNISIRELAGNHATQATASARPLKTSTGASQWTNYDAVDDVLNITFPSALGSNCTIARANVGAAPTILTGQTIGTSYADSTDHAGLIIIDRALTGQETADLTAWLTAKGATS